MAQQSLNDKLVQGYINTNNVAIEPGQSSTLDRLLTAGSFESTYISTATTTLVKTGAGILRSITIGTTAAGTILIYDGLTAVNLKGTFKASMPEGVYLLDWKIITGITIVTGAASLITVAYL